MSIKINGRSYPYQSSYNGLNIIEVCQLLKQPITALCFLKQCSNIARCGLCLVSVNHALKLACATKIADGDQIEIDTPEIKQAVLTKVNGLLNRHQFNCGSCSRRHNCEFLKLVITTKAKKTSQSKPHELKTLSDDRSAAIVLDQSKCLGCNRCVANCKYRTGLDCLKLIPTPINKQPGLAVCPIDPKKPLDQSKCLLCGQCILACPTGALSEKSHIDRILAAIKDQKTYVVCAIAPSVRTALGEEFGFPYGTDVIKKIYTALKQIGIDQVYDLNFAADLTIFEEAFEFVNRLGINIEPLLKKLNLKRDHPNVVHHHPLPLITSCCPA
jgi:NADH-quinone oxidoreductase subunit G